MDKHTTENNCLSMDAELIFIKFTTKQLFKAVYSLLIVLMDYAFGSVSR